MSSRTCPDWPALMEIAPDLQFMHYTVAEAKLPAEALANLPDVPLEAVAICCDLDLADDVLAELDWVQASIHGGQRGSREQLTKRSVSALENPHVSALSHPTGRYIGRRPPNAVDIEAVIAVAKQHGKAIETNGLPDRLDLRDEHVRLAIEAGVPIVCNTDSHSIRGLGNMRNAVGTARRGWATAADVLNTRPLAAVIALRGP